ncbi:MAG: hypothetical protein ACFFC9_11095 [Promethearchaeota archaeon]
MVIDTKKNTNFLRNYPFSLLDVDGLLERWQKIYSPYIDSIESKIIISKKNHIKTFKNHNFGFSNASQQRIADLVTIEVEEKNSNPVSKNSIHDLEKPKVRIEDQYSDVVEKENYNLKITFIFTNKKIKPFKLIQMLKLSDEVKRYIELLHKKELRQYSKIIPQMIIISLFGFEPSIGNYLKNNLHGILKRNISTLVVPPIENNLWNNFLVENPRDSINKYKKYDSSYTNLTDTRDISDYNSQQAVIWADALNIENSYKLLDINNSRKMIKEQIIQ